jgi:general secretion pathway protein G
MNGRKTHRTRRAGFTLTEMLIVLAILVMLVALVVPGFLGAQRRADRQNAQAQIGLLRGALERYAMDAKSFPATEQGLQALISQPSDSEAGPAASWDGPYLSTDAIPRDPWGNEYQYVYPPERNPRDFPDIWSFGPDGEDGTEDDITNWSVTAEGGEEGVLDEGKGGEMPPSENLDIEVDVEF